MASQLKVSSDNTTTLWTSLIYVLLVAATVAIIYVGWLETKMVITALTVLYWAVGFFLVQLTFRLMVRIFGGRVR